MDERFDSNKHEDGSEINTENQIASLQSTDDKNNYTFKLEHISGIRLDRRSPWLIKGLMPKHGLHLLYGSPGTGKSFVALNVALHVALERDWAGRAVKKGNDRGVVYVAAEAGKSFRQRVVAAKKALDVPDDTPFVLITTAPDLGDPKITARLFREIKEQSESMGFVPALIVLDTLSRSISNLRESDSQDMMKFVRVAENLSEKFNALVMPIHHCGKDESKGMRGSSALHGAADAEWQVSRDETGCYHISVEKMKDGPDGLQATFKLNEHLLCKDEDNDDITTLVAEVSGFSDNSTRRAGTQTKGSTGRNQVDITHTVLRVLTAQTAGSASNSESSPTIVGITKSELRKFIVDGDLFNYDNAASSRKALSRALDTLVDEKKITKETRDREEIFTVLSSPLKSAVISADT